MKHSYDTTFLTMYRHGLGFMTVLGGHVIFYACSKSRVQPELSILATGQKDRGLWGREWAQRLKRSPPTNVARIRILDPAS